MNKKRTNVFRGAALTLALLLLLPLLAACGKGQDGATGVPSLTVENGKLTFSLRLGEADLKAHEGQTAYLYELKPGETVYDVNKKSAMLQNSVSQRIRFVFPLEGENGEDRRCNTYLMTFSDGTVYSSPVYLSNPEALATVSKPEGSANDVKAMQSGYEELARGLHASHSVISLSASELLSGETAASWNGTSLAINQSILDETDKRALAAANAGLQISLELSVGGETPVADCAALINWLLERYQNPETGLVTGLILLDRTPSATEDELYGASVERMSAIASCAKLAMTSRVKDGGVYFGAAVNAAHLKQYASDVLTAVEESVGGLTGIALYPRSTTAALEAATPAPAAETETEAEEEKTDAPLLLSELPALAEEIWSEQGRSLRFAVMGLAISAENPDLQAALCAYAYRVARNIHADLLVYSTPVDQETGLYDADGVRRSAADCFDLMDTAENLTAEALAANLLGEEWSALSAARAVRVSATGLSNADSSENVGKRYLDFSDGDAKGFVAAGGASTPTVTGSDAPETDILLTSVLPESFGAASGVRKNRVDAKDLKDAYVLTAGVLPQSSRDGDSAEITLLLEGRAEDGRAISLRSTVTLSCNSWQTPAFQIRSFTAQLDEDSTVSMTFTMKPVLNGDTSSESADGEGDASPRYAFGLHSVSLRSAERDYSGLLLAAMIGGGFAIGFSVVLILSLGKRRRERRRSA